MGLVAGATRRPHKKANTCRTHRRDRTAADATLPLPQVLDSTTMYPRWRWQRETSPTCDANAKRAPTHGADHTQTGKVSPKQGGDWSTPGESMQPRLHDTAATTICWERPLVSHCVRLSSSARWGASGMRKRNARQRLANAWRLREARTAPEAATRTEQKRRGGARTWNLNINEICTSKRTSARDLCRTKKDGFPLPRRHLCMLPRTSGVRTGRDAHAYLE